MPLHEEINKLFFDFTPMLGLSAMMGELVYSPCPITRIELKNGTTIEFSEGNAFPKRRSDDAMMYGYAALGLKGADIQKTFCAETYSPPRAQYISIQERRDGTK